MSKLIAVVFDDHATAFDLRADLVRMEQDHLLGLNDAVVVTRGENGKPRLHQAVNMTATGAIGGTWWGTLIGMLFLNPLLGAAIGAGAGAMSGALTDIGIDDQFMRDVGSTLQANNAAVFVLVRDITQDRVLEGMEKYRGKGSVYKTSLSRQDEKRLRDLLEAA